MAVETTVDSKEARAVTSTSASVTACRRAGSKRGGGVTDMNAKAYSRGPSVRSADGERCDLD